MCKGTIVQGSRSRKNGFSLIELIVVIAILAAVAFAVPSFTSASPKHRARSAAWDLAADLNWARGRAMAEQNPYIVAFDPADGSYSVYDDNGRDGIDTGDLVRTRRLSTAGAGVIFGYVAGNGPDDQAIESAVTMGSTESPIRQEFHPSGRALHSGTAFIIHTRDLDQGEAGGQLAVSTYRTGKVRVWERRRDDGEWH